MKYGFCAALFAVISTQIEGWFSIVLMVIALVLLLVCGYKLDKEERNKKTSKVK